MLPWLFAILLALNLALLWWGRQHEVPIEPQLPPLAEAPQQIQLLGTELEQTAPPAAGTAEPPAPVTDAFAQPDTNAPPDSMPLAQPEQAAPRSEDRNTPPEDGAAAGAPPAIEPLGFSAPNEPAPESPSASVPKPDPAEVPTPETEPAGGADPGLEAALPAAAAAAPKAVKKRKAKRRARKPPLAEPVELPPTFQ
jgi:hypothetical protein